MDMLMSANVRKLMVEGLLNIQGRINSLSHRMSADVDTEDSQKNETFARSRIAGGINCLVLKLMGYSGYVRLSAFEDKYGQI